MNTPDPFANEVESLCVEYEDSVLDNRFRTRLRAILARVRAAAMMEAAEIAKKTHEEEQHETGWEWCTCDELEKSIRSAAARILEESRGN